MVCLISVPPAQHPASGPLSPDVDATNAANQRLAFLWGLLNDLQPHFGLAKSASNGGWSDINRNREVILALGRPDLHPLPNRL